MQVSTRLWATTHRGEYQVTTCVIAMVTRERTDSSATSKQLRHCFMCRLLLDYHSHRPSSCCQQKGCHAPCAQLYVVLCCAVQEALAKEVHFLQKLKHPNLVTFYGVCLERPMVVMVSQHQVLSTVYAKTLC